MLDIQIWTPSKIAASKNPLNAEIKAVALAADVGHVSFSITIYNNNPVEIAQMKVKFPGLLEQAPPLYTSESKQKLSEVQNIDRRLYQRKELIQGIRATNSFWPLKPVNPFGLFFGLIKSHGKSTGKVKSRNRTLEEDMRYETVGKKKYEILHESQRTIQMAVLNQQYEDLANKLNHFKMAHLSILAKAKMNLHNTKKKFRFWHDNANEQRQNPLNIKQTLMNVQNSISGIVGDEQKIKQEIIEVENKMKSLQLEIEAYDITPGRYPDVTFSLPSTNAEGHFHLDETRILEQMMLQREMKYDLLGYNCSHSVKACILKGISDTMKNEMQKLGVEDNFFKLNKLETPCTVQCWLFELAKYIHQINEKYEQGLELAKSFKLALR